MCRSYCMRILCVILVALKIYAFKFVAPIYRYQFISFFNDIRTCMQNVHVFTCNSTPDPPSPPSFNVPEDIKEGQWMALSCHASSMTLPQTSIQVAYSWSRDGIPISYGNPPPRHSVWGQSGQTVIINPADREDSGLPYQCVAWETGPNILNSTSVTEFDVKCESATNLYVYMK